MKCIICNRELITGDLNSVCFECKRKEETLKKDRNDLLDSLYTRLYCLSEENILMSGLRFEGILLTDITKIFIEFGMSIPEEPF